MQLLGIYCLRCRRPLPPCGDTGNMLDAARWQVLPNATDPTNGFLALVPGACGLPPGAGGWGLVHCCCRAAAAVASAAAGWLVVLPLPSLRPLLLALFCRCFVLAAAPSAQGTMSWKLWC